MVFGKILEGVISFFKGIAPRIKEAWNAADIYGKVGMVFTGATVAVGVKGFLEMREMLSAGQSIMANKTAAGGKIPVIYGTRRVGTQIVYMDTFGNDNRDLYVVYALAVGECEEILGRTIEIDGNSILDAKIFKKGGYVGSDKISSGAGSLCTADQNGDTNAGVGGGLGTDPTRRYQFVFNLHHGADSQTADPMLRASIPNAWSTNHKLNGICYIAAHFHYSKTGVFQGVPQITVQVKGKKVYDPRESGHTFGDPSTYEWSSNPALCYLDYITNDSYGKGLAESDINMSTFETAATKCDVEVDQPYYNGAYQSLTWSGTSGDDFIVISDNDEWYQNKTDEVFDLRDNGGSSVFTGSGRITGVQRHQFYDDDLVNKIFINETLTSTYTNEAGSARAKVKRFHCNGYIDTNKSVMDNSKELLANMRGIFSYINGKYELQIEDTGSSTFSITEDHIIGSSGLSIDYGNKDKKANKVVIEFYNSQLDYELDTATVLHDATPEYYSDDGEILEVKAQFPLITDAYIAYNMGKAILTRSRNQMSIRFLGTPEMYKLNVGDIVDITYAGLDLSTKICRVEALELQSNGLVGVSLIEYFDVYTWEVPAQEDARKLLKIPTRGAIHPPEASSIVFTDTDASPINRPTLTWTEPDDFDVKEFRVDVVDSSDNNVFSKRVNTPSVDLSFLPKASNYEASITCFNTFNVESEPVTKTFTIADDPVKTTEVAISGENLSNVIDYGTIAGGGNQNFFQIKTRLDLEDRFLWNSNGDNYWALGTAGDDDVNLKIEGGANTLIQFKDQDNALGTVKIAFGDDVIGDYSHDFIHLVADYTQGEHATDAKSIFYIKGRASDGNSSASGNIAKFTFGSADGIGFPSSVLYGTTTTPILIAEDYIEIEQATAPSTTTDKLYNVSGTLYWNGGAVNTGAGDITSVTINTAGGGLTGGASFSSGDATFTLAIGSNIQGDKTFDDNVVIEGDLTVQGTTTTIDTTNLDVKDKNITLNYGTGDTSANADGAGITIQDAVNSTTDATILWATANDTFNFSHPVSVTGNITSSNTVTSQSINVSSSGYGVIEVGGVSGAYIDLKRPNTDDYDLRLISFGTGGEIDTGSGDLVIKRQGSTRIATTSSGIDVTGDISIGTDSGDPFNINAKIKIQDSGTAYIQIKTGTSNFGGLLVGDTADDFAGGFIYDNNGDVLRLYSNNNVTLELDDNYDVNVYQGGLKIGGTEVITSSANLTNIGTISSGAITSTGISLFGKTVADNTTNGIRIDGTNDFVSIVRDGDLPLLLNRKTSDGTIALFRKDGLDVGVISTESGRLNIGTGDAGISFLENQDRVIPRLTSGGNADASIDLGDSASRFRNLYLSGTISSGGITSTGNITTTGAFKSGGANNYILFDYDGDFTGGNYYAIQDTSANRLRISYGFSATDNLELDASGNFYVNGGNSTFAGTISSGDITITGDFPRLYFVDTAGTDLDAYIVNNANGLFFGKTNTPSASNDVMALDLTNKRVGIGTASPSTALEVNNSSAGATVATFEGNYSASGDVKLAVFERSGGAVASAIEYNDATTDMEFGTTTSHNFSLKTADTRRLTITSDGNVGIGTTSPDESLHVAGSFGDAIVSKFENTGLATSYIEFANSAASGVYIGSRGQRLTFAPAGTETMVLDNLGRLGIGTSSPSDPLHISHASAGNAALRIDNTGDDVRAAFFSGTGYFGINALNVANTATKNIVLASNGGNVGIGTTNPAQKLEVNTGSEGYVARFKGATSAVDIYAGYTGSFTGGLITTPTNIPLGFSTNTGAGSLIIDTSGNVGIGTSSPSVPSGGGLSIYNSTIPRINFKNSTTGDGSTDGLEIYINGLNALVNNREAGSLSFGTSNTTRATIDSSGNVGIGTSPNFKLHVSHADQDGLRFTAPNTAETFIDFGDTDDNDIGRISYDHADNHMAFRTNNTERMRIDSSGRVGIGTSSPDGNLEVVGTTVISGESDTVNAVLMGLSGTNRTTIQLDTADTTHTNRQWGLTNIAGDFYIGRHGLSVMTMKNDGNVGIGITSPSATLDVAGRFTVASNDGHSDTKIISTSNRDPRLYFLEGTTQRGYIQSTAGTSQLLFGTGSTERMRIDTSGRLLVGKTSSNSATVGVEARGTGNLLASATSNFSGFFNRLSTDGTIVEFAKDDYSVGSIGTSGGDIYIDSVSGGVGILSNAGTGNYGWTSSFIYPIIDNARDLGTSSFRFKDLHLSGTANIGTNAVLSNGTLTISQGSGANYSTQISTEYAYPKINTRIDAIAGTSYEGQILFRTSSGGGSATERMRIDSSGNLLVGTTGTIYGTTGRGVLEVNGSSSSIVALKVNNGAAGYMYHSGTNMDVWNNLAGYLRFATSGTERMRIDSSGNLLVGKTATGLANAGIEATASNILRTTKANSASAEFNRTGTDGDIAIFWKDTSIVGSIGAKGTDLYIGTGDVGLAFYDYSTENAILPHNPATNAFADASIDLGRGTSGSAYRFKNLYLSGDINADGDISTSGELQVDSIANIDGALTSGAITALGTVKAVRTDTLTQWGIFGQDSSGGYITQHRNNASLYENFRFLASNTSGTVERARIDTTGNLLVGTTSETSWETAKGFRTRQSGSTTITRDGNPPLYINRLTSDGVVMVLKRGTATKGQIGILSSVATSTVYFASGSSSSSGTGLKFVAAAGANQITPCRGDGTNVDNVIDLGSSVTRFDDIYATNGTIQTSDRNEKQDIQELSDAEQRVAIACKGLIRRYKFNSAVAEKGDDARYHFGIIAQDLQDAFTAEGLDAGDYGMFISNTWTDEEGNEQTRLGVRYNELLAFIIATL